MKEYAIVTHVCVYDYEELPADERELVDVARKSTYNSYAPYSHFYVGAALRLQNGVIIPGCNQENAASPVTICAERSAIFAAGAQYPDQPVIKLAISARNDEGFMQEAIPPCGSCRQVLLETEERFRQPIRILLACASGIHVVDTIRALLPMQFVAESMKSIHNA